MPPRLPDAKRAAILADIRQRSESCRGLAKKHGVSTASIRAIAAEARITDAFSRENVEKATRAAVADNRSRRARIASELLDDVQKLRQRAWSPYTYYERGTDGPELVTLEQPPLKEAKEAYVSIGICLQRHAELEKLDAGRGDEGARSMLGDLASALEQVARGPVEP